MGTESLFVTQVHAARLQQAGSVLNLQLLRECRQLRLDDAAGRRWSADNYPGGYTSYDSASRMQERSPTFARLARLIDQRARAFARSLAFDFDVRRLVMTDCWVNIMPRGVVHSGHLHPLSLLSGTYYVATPRGAAGLKLEDPRLERFMAAPPRRRNAPRALRPWVVIPAQAGRVVLFESWLRHEVPPGRGPGERISISFNYGTG
ncbi:MAG: TIGR02466 family protein [Steroidobacteraceae bacterium]